MSPVLVNTGAPLEVSALARIEHNNDRGTTFTLRLEGGRCAMTISAQDQSASNMFNALREGDHGELTSP